MAAIAASDRGPVVLLIEDDPEIRHGLRAALLSQQCRLVETVTGRTGLRAAKTRRPDVVILDLDLADMDRLERIRQLRRWTAAPILAISARDQEADAVTALDAGANDYLTKPFRVAEVVARIRVWLRHAARADRASDEQPVKTGDLRVDAARRQVLLKGQDMHLTPTEYRLLTTLARHVGKVLTHNELLNEVWGPGSAHQFHYLHVYMAQLRRKVERDPAQPRYLVTVPYVGYRLASE
jgi:two-component system KDP operon response regulator KdpE